MNGSVVMLRVIILCDTYSECHLCLVLQISPLCCVTKKPIMLSVVIVSVMAPIFRVAFSFVMLSAIMLNVVMRRYDTQHDDIQHNDTLHNGIQHNSKKNTTLS